MRESVCERVRESQSERRVGVSATVRVRYHIGSISSDPPSVSRPLTTLLPRPSPPHNYKHTRHTHTRTPCVGGVRSQHTYIHTYCSGEQGRQTIQYRVRVCAPARGGRFNTDDRYAEHPAYRVVGCWHTACRSSIVVARPPTLATRPLLGQAPSRRGLGRVISTSIYLDWGARDQNAFTPNTYQPVD